MLFEAFLSSTAMESVFSPTAVVQSMMDVEAALARAATGACGYRSSPRWPCCS